MLTQKRLKELLCYNPETGVFTWNGSRSGIREDGICGWKSSSTGYIEIKVEGILFGAHRLAFLYMLGYFPENDVDHIDRCRINNSWNNLREVSHQCNLRNTGNYRNNKSGVKGVSYCKSISKWLSRIKINGKQISLASSKDFCEAVCYRLAAEQAENWHGCDSSSPAFKYVQNYLTE